MLYELAFMPDVFDAQVNQDDAEHLHELREILVQLADVGMVANLDSPRWQSSVLARLDDWPANRSRSDIKACLNVLLSRHRLIAYPKRKSGPPQDEAQWFDLVRELHKKAPFDWVVAGPRLRPAKLSKTETAAQVLDIRRSEKWRPRHSTTVRMCESEYRPPLAPLLRHAKRLELVDPYLSPRSKRAREFIRICSEWMGLQGSHQKSGEIHIHTTLKPSNAPSASEALDDWARAIHHLKRSGCVHSYKVVIWRSDAGDDDMHDRFLLTDQCGVSIPRGLECLPEATTRKTIWSLLDEEDYRATRIAYEPQLKPNAVLDQREIN